MILGKIIGDAYCSHKICTSSMDKWINQKVNWHSVGQVLFASMDVIIDWWNVSVWLQCSGECAINNVKEVSWGMGKLNFYAVPW